MMKMTALYGILDNLASLHKALYTLAIEKKDVLIRGEIDELTRITQREQKLIKGIENAEASRIALVREIYGERKLPLVDGSLSELMKSLTGVEEKAKLNEYRNELLRIVSELRDANELNQQLLEQSLGFVNISLDLVTDNPAEDFIYKKPTQSLVNSKTNRSFINRQA